MELTPERLKSIAVKCVSQFMTKQATLNEGIAKEASDLNLNSEQVKRVIETTNTLAYLRQLEGNPDRTFEFPVAGYKEVMASLCIPTNAACELTEDEDVLNKEANEFQAIDYSPSFQEKSAMLVKETLRCKSILVKMACDKEALAHDLVKTSAKIGKDPEGLEKLAEIVEEEDFDKMLKLCGIEKTAARKLVFKDKDLVEVKETYNLYKLAKELVAEEIHMKASVDKAETIIKEAGIAGTVGKAIGGAALGLGGLAIKGVSAPFKSGFGAGAKKVFKVGETAVGASTLKDTSPDVWKSLQG